MHAMSPAKQNSTIGRQAGNDGLTPMSADGTRLMSFISDGGDVVTGNKPAWPAPGHTPGHMVYRLQSRKGRGGW